MGKLGKLVASIALGMSVVLCGCAQPGPQSAVEVYDKYVEGSYDNYKMNGNVDINVSGKQNMSFEPADDVEVVESSGEGMSVDIDVKCGIKFDAEVTKDVSHVLLDMSLDFSGFSMNLTGDMYTDNNAKVVYSKFDMPALFGGEVGTAEWKASKSDNLVSDDATTDMRGAFEKATFEESNGNYVVTMTLADIMNTAALDKEQADSLAESLGGNTEVLSKVQLVFTFDSDCHLLSVTVPDYQEEADGMTTKVSADVKFDNYGLVDVIEIPEDAKKAKVEDASELGSLLGGGDVSESEAVPVDLGTDVVSDFELEMNDTTTTPAAPVVNDVNETKSV